MLKIVKKVARREFLKRTAGAVAAFGVPTFIPASALGRDGRPAPSERIVMGCIGTGYQGKNDMKGFLELGMAQVAAVCDVDAAHRDEAAQIVEERYAQDSPSGIYKGVSRHNDFRELIARDDIDALLIVVPDHWHAIATIEGVRAGKDVYGEKPLALTIAEGRAMCDAVRRHGRVFQTGTQLRSMNHTWRAASLVRNRRIGDLRRIEVGCKVGPTIEPQPEMPVPPGFDYDFWLGPAPWQPYTEKRCHWNFRYILDYSGGEVTDHGIHDVDFAVWGAGDLMTGPIEIRARGTFPATGLYDVATDCYAEFRFGSGLEMIFSTGSEVIGTRFEGTEGWVEVNQGSMRLSDERLRTSAFGPNDIHLPRSGSHAANFLESIRTRHDPIAPIEQAHQGLNLLHLVNIGMQLGRTLTWDPEKERFLNDPEADRLVSRDRRSPWSLG